MSLDYIYYTSFSSLFFRAGFGLCAFLTMATISNVHRILIAAQDGKWYPCHVIRSKFGTHISSNSAGALLKLGLRTQANIFDRIQSKRRVVYAHIFFRVFFFFLFVDFVLNAWENYFHSSICCLHKCWENIRRVSARVCVRAFIIVCFFLVHFVSASLKHKHFRFVAYANSVLVYNVKLTQKSRTTHNAYYFD